MSIFLRSVQEFVWEIVRDVIKACTVPWLFGILSQIILSLQRRYWPVPATEAPRGRILPLDRLEDHLLTSDGLPFDHEDITQETSEIHTGDGWTAESDGIGGGCGDTIYVVLLFGKTKLSMDALLWTLNHAVVPGSTHVHLIHVFPETHYIPIRELGMSLPVSQVNPLRKDYHMVEERSKRTEFLKKFLKVCSASQISVEETILIESDMEAKTLLDLIRSQNIRKLVMGTTKSRLRKLRSRSGNEVAAQVLQNAPEFCEVKIICQGKEVDSTSEQPSPHGCFFWYASPWLL